MSEELKRHKEALEVAMQGLRDMGSAWYYEVVESKVNAILHPEPEYEKVEIVRWSSGTCSDVFLTEAEAADPRNVCGPVVKLTGTLRRQKPVKLERSVTVEVRSDEDGDLFWDDEDGDGDYPLRKYPDAHNKRGTLVFTWTE